MRRKTSAADLVSAADHASEEAIVALLRAERPDDAIVGEEGASVGAGSRRWLVDGLDGTVNFLRAIPQWCVAVVLEEDGEPLATAVLDPARGELFSAARGEGAHRDGVALRVRDGAPLREAVLSSFLRADKLRGTPPAASFGRLAEAAAMLRMGGAGSLELAWVAAGHIDAWAQPNVDAWDWLPGRLLVQEAGGRTAVIDGDPLTWFVAGGAGDVRGAGGAGLRAALAAPRSAQLHHRGKGVSGGRGARRSARAAAGRTSVLPPPEGGRPTFDTARALDVERRSCPVLRGKTDVRAPQRPGRAPEGLPSLDDAVLRREAPQATHRLAPWTRTDPRRRRDVAQARRAQAGDPSRAPRAHRRRPARAHVLRARLRR